MFLLRFRSLELLYSITAFIVCQELFSKFFDFRLSPWSPLVWQLFNFNTSKTVCQEVFSFFFKLFRRCFSIPQPLEATFISYHSVSHLSRTFFISFQIQFTAGRPRGQLAYTSTYQTICQAQKQRFCNFQNIFLFGRLPRQCAHWLAMTCRNEKGRACALPTIYI